MEEAVRKVINVRCVWNKGELDKKKDGLCQFCIHPSSKSQILLLFLKLSKSTDKKGEKPGEIRNFELRTVHSGCGTA